MQLALYSRLLKDSDVKYVKYLLDLIGDRKDTSVTVYAPYLDEIKEKLNLDYGLSSFVDYNDVLEQSVDFLICLGGDGTILDIPSLVRDADIPVVGVNLGRLGFLSSIEKDKLSQLIDCLHKKAYYIEDRTLLNLDSERSLFGNKNFALNDCTISKRDTSSMIVIHSYIDGKFLNSYWADGIIISTPTGSTGYSLSCGGPIIAPETGNFVITPVAPHNLNVRPIIVSDNSVIELEIEGRADHYLCTLDSRFELINKGEKITIVKNEFPTKLLRLNEIDFYQTIRNKLAWGVDSRNFKST